MSRERKGREAAARLQAARGGGREARAQQAQRVVEEEEDAEGELRGRHVRLHAAQVGLAHPQRHGGERAEQVHAVQRVHEARV